MFWDIWGVYFEEVFQEWVLEDDFKHEKAPGGAEGVEHLFRLVLFYAPEQG